MSLTDIAEETGISYATLRNYALKYGGEIPSEGIGRSTRYPRTAVKVFQRLRKESKPGRKPASALPVQAPAPIQQDRQERQETAQRIPPPAPADRSGLERELAAIRAHLGSIAESLTFLVSSQKNVVLSAVAAPVAPAAPVPPVEAVPAAVAPAVAAPVAVEQERTQREGKEAKESEGHRRLHSMPKVWGQRGKRPD